MEYLVVVIYVIAGIFTPIQKEEDEAKQGEGVRMVRRYPPAQV